MIKNPQKKPDYTSLPPLKQYRLKVGLTLAQLSEKSGVNIRQIQRVESGSSKVSNLTAKNFIALADALEIDPHDLLDSDCKQ